MDGPAAAGAVVLEKKKKKKSKNVFAQFFGMGAKRPASTPATPPADDAERSSSAPRMRNGCVPLPHQRRSHKKKLLKAQLEAEARRAEAARSSSYVSGFETREESGAEASSSMRPLSAPPAAGRPASILHRASSDGVDTFYDALYDLDASEAVFPDGHSPASALGVGGDIGHTSWRSGSPLSNTSGSPGQADDFLWRHAAAAGGGAERLHASARPAPDSSYGRGRDLNGDGAAGFSSAEGTYGRRSSISQLLANLTTATLDESPRTSSAGHGPLRPSGSSGSASSSAPPSVLRPDDGGARGGAGVSGGSPAAFAPPASRMEAAGPQLGRTPSRGGPAGPSGGPGGGSGLTAGLLGALGLSGLGPSVGPSSEAELAEAAREQAAAAARLAAAGDPRPRAGSIPAMQEAADAPHVRERWSNPASESFMLRGKDYLKDRKKLPSAPQLYRLAGADVWRTDRKIDHITQRVKLDHLMPPGSGCSGPDSWADGLPPLLILHAHVPNYPATMHWLGGENNGPGWSTVFYYVLDRSALHAGTAASQLRSLMRDVRFGPDGRETNPKAKKDFRDRLKVIARVWNVDECPKTAKMSSTEVAIVRRFNAIPVLTRPCHRFYLGPNYLEIIIDCHNYNYFARTTLYGCITRLRHFVWQGAFLIQGNTPAELPEQLLAASSMHRIEFDAKDKAPPCPAAFHDNGLCQCGNSY